MGSCGVIWVDVVRANATGNLMTTQSARMNWKTTRQSLVTIWRSFRGRGIECQGQIWTFWATRIIWTKSDEITKIVLVRGSDCQVRTWTWALMAKIRQTISTRKKWKSLRIWSNSASAGCVCSILGRVKTCSRFPTASTYSTKDVSKSGF